MSVFSTIASVICATVCLVSLTPSQFANAAGQTFGNWRVECSDKGLCSMTSADAGEVGLTLSRKFGELEREADDKPSWAVSFKMPVAEDPQISLKIGERAPVTLERGYGLLPFGSDGTNYLADEALLVTIVDQLLGATSLSLSLNESYEVSEGTAVWNSVDMVGFADAFAFIEVHQKFKGTPHMADMPGWLKPANPLGDAADLPQKVKQAHWHSGECQPLQAKTPEQVRAFESHRLSVTLTLYLIECNYYAYNSDVRAYIAEMTDGVVSRITTVAVPKYDSRIGASTLISGGSFNPATQRLSSFHKGRGIGDCGTSETWRYTGYDSFILVEISYRACRDNNRTDENAVMPEWPVVYRLGVKDVSVLNGK